MMFRTTQREDELSPSSAGAATGDNHEIASVSGATEHHQFRIPENMNLSNSDKHQFIMMLSQNQNQHLRCCVERHAKQCRMVASVSFQALHAVQRLVQSSTSEAPEVLRRQRHAKKCVHDLIEARHDLNGVRNELNSIVHPVMNGFDATKIEPIDLNHTSAGFLGRLGEHNILYMSFE